MVSNHLKLVVLGTFVHAVLLYSIFDIYYSSPLVQGTQPHPITKGSGLAKRLVVISADGLRSDSFFQNPHKSPFLHSIIRKNEGCWGISASHVPTESRPGHVALLAGFYEDVSAVARGWKLNPVPFDSIINRSRIAWAWGSPDIVPMFTKGIHHATAYAYSPDEEKFFTADAAELDRWVFKNFEKFIKDSKDEKIYFEKAVFFLHLLGLDTNGHGSKPYSKNYIDNINVVDKGIERIVWLFSEVFNDNKTAFIFVSDHGMTDWGSHGAGTDSEILTPFVAWGSGVKHLTKKMAINQVDTSPFLAALLGVAIPMNSVGVLPHECLDATPKYIFQSSYANLMQMLEQFMLKRQEKKDRSFSLFFREYKVLPPQKISAIQKEIRRFADLGRYEAAAFTSLQWIPHVRAGLLYFHRYERSMLGLATLSTFICWILLLFFYGSRMDTMDDVKSLFAFNRFTSYPLIAIGLLLIVLRFPLSSYLYILLPFYLVSILFNIFTNGVAESANYLAALLSCFNMVVSFSTFELMIIFLKFLTLAVFSGTLLTVLTSIFTKRSLLSMLLILLAFFPYLKAKTSKSLQAWKWFWSFLCFILAIFPQLPAVGRTPSPFFCICSPTLSSLFLFILSCKANFKLMTGSLRILGAIHICTALVIAVTEFYGQLNRPVFLLLRILCWFSLPVTFLLPAITPNLLIGRIIIWFSAMFVPYALLSLSYESLFLLVFFIFLIVYVRISFEQLSDEQFWEAPILKKRRLKKVQDESILTSMSIWSHAIIAVIFVEISFFGTGNVASLNSFNPSFLRCFLNVFSPFLMAGLLVFKIAIPFLAISLTLIVILEVNKAGTVKFSLILLMITDAMATVFFFQLVDDGSWLEIGTSISHYVISMLMSVIVFLLLQCAQRLLSFSLHKTIISREYQYQLN